MRPFVFVGLLLIALGGVLFYRGSITTRKKVLEVGDVKVTAPDKHSVPPWAAGAVVIVGLGLVVAGMPRSGRA